MSSAKGGSTNTGRSSSLPIFVFPEELQFVEADRASHKQILTIYNPYSFSVRFKGTWNDIREEIMMASQ